MSDTRFVSTRLQVRSYELDSFGHLNHAVFLNHFEHARFDAFESLGFPASKLLARGEAIHVVRVEVDYRAELVMGREIEIRTSVHEMRNSSLTLAQRSVDPNDPDHVFAEALVTVVWIGPNRRPMRIPDDVRTVFSQA